MKKDEVDKNSIKEFVNKASITKKIEQETVKLQAETLMALKEAESTSNEIILKRLEARRKIRTDKTSAVLYKMLILSEVMSTTFSQDSNLPGNHLFNDDDLIDYKAKMKELLKQL